MLVRSNHLFPMLFNDVFGTGFEDWKQNPSRAPKINIKENSAEFVLEFLVPGLSKEDLSLTVDSGNNLVVVMEHKQDAKPLPQPAEAEAKATDEHTAENTAQQQPEPYRYLRHDFRRTHFRQLVALPDGIHRDRIHAKVESGILRVTLPKVTPEEQAKMAQTIAIE